MFGDAIITIHAQEHTEDVTDDLIKIFLKICNPMKEKLFVAPKMPQKPVKVCTFLPNYTIHERGKGRTNHFNMKRGEPNSPALP